MYYNLLHFQALVKKNKNLINIRTEKKDFKYL